MSSCGLTLGKFAPLHKGHQHVIGTALSETDHLVVLTYDSEVTDIPLPVRSRWIRTLYPQVTVIECWDGPRGYSGERSYEIAEENYITGMLAGRKITHFYSSEPYGGHVSRALGAVDRQVDPARAAFPISATTIRTDPFGSRGCLDPLVYADMLTKVVFVGAMSTGKSTIAEALAKKHNTTFAAEYGREYGRVPAYLEGLALRNQSRYDLFFLCEDDIPYDDTWDRSGPGKRAAFHTQIVADLLDRRIPFIRLTGSLEQRIATVDDVLARFRKFSNFFGNIELARHPVQPRPALP